VNIKRSLFELERISPALANKVWQFASLVKNPELGLDWRVISFSDTQIEAGFTARQFNSVALVAAERCTEMLWRRHLDAQQTKIVMTDINAHFNKEAESNCRIRCELPELERETVLTHLYSNKFAEAALTAGVFNLKNQSIATIEVKFMIQWSEPEGTLRLSRQGE
jgi:hypothetical protein